MIIEIGTRRIVHCNVTAHPTAEWILQQFREGIPGEHRYCFVIHERDRLYSRDLDWAGTDMGVKVLRMPLRAPQANAVCERLVGTIRRECLDFLIPFGERHLRRILLEWVTHYNQGRPHKSLGPGFPNRFQERYLWLLTDTACRATASFALKPFWADCITSIGWNK